MAEKSTFFIDLRIGESLSIDNGRAIAELMSKSGQRARFRFVADKSLKVDVMAVRAANQAQRGVKL